MRVTKFIFSLFFLIISTLVFSQDIYLNRKTQDVKDIQILEQKAAARTMNFRANPNTENYDLKYHRLEWTVDPAVEFVDGIVTSYFVAKSDMNTITFDLTDNMNVTQVLQRGVALSFVNGSDDELIITLPTTLLENTLDSLTVYYNGVPQNSGFDSFQVSTHAGTPILGTLSEPYGAKDWWPCKQDLIDKIDSIDVYVTHNSQYKAASNGLLISEIINGTNTTTHWKHRYPIPAYLIAIAVTNYSVYNDYVATGDFNVVNYVFPENLANAQNGTAITPAIMDLFGSLFELYPFADEKYGHAQFGWGGGMEHTTMSFMGNFSRGLIAHELAHQWFGDKITCGSWKDIWLNESFATYLTELVTENFDGDVAFKNWRNEIVDSNSWRCVTNSPNGSVFVTDTTSVGRIFDGRLSYRKGAMVLHMLRYKLGDVDFFQAIKNYLADPNLVYGYAKTEDLIQHFEAQSGEDLTEFFNDWFIGEGHPSFDLTYSQETTENLRIRINQTQSNASVSFFETPLPILITEVGGTTQLIRLEVTENNQLFILNYVNDVVSIEIDPDYHIISKNNSVTLGTVSTILETDIKVFPNPVKDILEIQVTDAIDLESVIIYNNLGQKVRQVSSKIEQISLKDLSAGVYVIEIYTTQGKIIKKIIKK